MSRSYICMSTTWADTENLKTVTCWMSCSPCSNIKCATQRTRGFGCLQIGCVQLNILLIFWLHIIKLRTNPWGSLDFKDYKFTLYKKYKLSYDWIPKSWFIYTPYHGIIANNDKSLLICLKVNSVNLFFKSLLWRTKKMATTRAVKDGNNEKM